MLQLNTFTSYDKKSSSLIDGKVFKKTNYCKNCISKEHSKCSKFYKNLDLSVDSKYICPYGFRTIVKSGNIITGLVTKETINSKTRNNLKKEIRNFPIYSEEQIDSLIEYSFMRDYELERYRETIHDVRNATTYFSLMIEEFRNNKNSEKLTKDEEALISLYELINFRLDVLDEAVISTVIEEKMQKLHPMIMKIVYMLSYKAKSRNIKIIVSPTQSAVIISRNLYLALFILIENSVKYSLSNSLINIDFEENENDMKIIIKNYSDKIMINNPDELLKKGIRGSNAKSLGSGIGLSFANELLEKSHAILKIEIVNQEENKDLFKNIIIIKKL